MLHQNREPRTVQSNVGTKVKVTSARRDMTRREVTLYTPEMYCMPHAASAILTSIRDRAHHVEVPEASTTAHDWFLVALEVTSASHEASVRN
jgi:hypothetical protein